MSPAVLSVAFLVVMAAALSCFARAYGVRRTTARHRRFAIAGAAIDVAGTLVVIVTARGLGWHVPPAFPVVATVHRACAYVTSAGLVAQVVTGAMRHPLHRRLGFPFLCAYAVTYALAVWAYAPWW